MRRAGRGDRRAARGVGGERLRAQRLRGGREGLPGRGARQPGRRRPGATHDGRRAGLCGSQAKGSAPRPCWRACSTWPPSRRPGRTFRSCAGSRCSSPARCPRLMRCSSPKPTGWNRTTGRVHRLCSQPPRSRASWRAISRAPTRSPAAPWPGPDQEAADRNDGPRPRARRQRPGR